MIIGFENLKVGANVYIVRTGNGIDIETNTIAERRGNVLTLENNTGVKIDFELPMKASIAKANDYYFVCADIASLVKVLTN